MRKLKVLFLILYTIILLCLIYRAYQAWQTNLITAYLTLIGLWTTGVWALNRLLDWIFHENVGLKLANIKIEGITKDVLPSMRPIVFNGVDYNGWVDVIVKNEGETIGKCTGTIKKNKGEYLIYDWISYSECVSLHRQPLDGADSFRMFDLEGRKTKHLYTNIQFASADSITVSINLGKKEWKKNFSLADIIK